jgi:hypothetical protein
MDGDEPHLVSNEKLQPIKWTERPTGALVPVGSFWLPEWVVKLVSNVLCSSICCEGI